MFDTGNGLVGSFNDDLLKLEEIFLPNFFYEKMRYYFSSSGLVNNDVLFVHYTSAASALDIIREKRVVMRNALHVTDYREVTDGFKVMADLVSDKNERWVDFLNCIEDVLPGIMDRVMSIYDAHSINDKVYLLSVLEHDESENELGRLSMWRAFSAQSEPVALVLKIPALSAVSQALGISFNPVLYAEKGQQYLAIDEVIKNVKNHRSFLKKLNPDLVATTIVSMLLVNIVCVKHKGFQDEREWRCIYLPEYVTSEASSRLIEFGVEEFDGLPQNIYKIPLTSAVDPVLSDIDFCKIFDGLIIGPSEFSDGLYKSFCQELKEIGVLEAESKVRVSDIPVR